MQRYFIATEQFGETEVRIAGDAAHHIIKVMRSRVGERFICSDFQTRAALVELRQAQGREVIAEIIEHLPMDAEPQVAVWIAQALPKGDKLETVVQKCTEIGAARFIPFTSQRTVVKYEAKQRDSKTARWRKIAQEAAEQAHRDRIPVVEPICTWEQVLALAAEADTVLFCYEQELDHSLRRAVQAAKGAKNMLIVIGPEGGFSEAEAEQAAAAGCHLVGLGKRILRTETAAMVALTCILYEFGELGG